MTIPILPPLDRSSMSFKTDVDTFFGTLLNAFSVAMAAAINDVNSNSAAATAAASTVAYNVALMASYASAPTFTPGTYPLNFVAHAANRRLYYKTTASSAVSTDPASDPANWAIVSPLLVLTTEQRGTAAISSGVLSLDLASAIISVPLTSNITSIVFNNNVAGATACQAMTLELVADGTARTVVWPGGDGTSTLLIRWPSGVAPVLTSTNGKRDTFFFKSVSQFLWDAFIVGQAS